MLRRKIENKLIEWKNNSDKKILLVNGARQVGKTFIIEKFGKENYENYVEINFIKVPSYMEIFDGDLDPDTIYKKMTLKKIKLIPGKTLIFLDEIQECQAAITALKFLQIDGKYDIIASGSLLGIAYKRTKSFPVGYVNRLEMNSLDFEEFLWANGIDEETINYVKDFYKKRKTVPESVHNTMMNYFKEYIVIGGMPKVVDDFVTNQDFMKAGAIQDEIIADYRDDIVKYADKNEKVKIRLCFDSIPIQLAKEYKKFQYSLIDKKGTYGKYFGSLMWLYDAGIINFCYNLKLPEDPLNGNYDEEVFKVYMKDTGLLMAMLDEDAKEKIINGDLGIYKGAIYENIIADIFGKQEKKLFYFEHNSTLEIDFIIKYDKKVTAVEVKSADNTKSKSMTSIINNWNVEQGIKLSSKNTGISKDGKILSFPIYMSMFF